MWCVQKKHTRRSKIYNKNNNIYKQKHTRRSKIYNNNNNIYQQKHTGRSKICIICLFDIFLRSV